jgi:hypothetical protein
MLRDTIHGAVKLDRALLDERLAPMAYVTLRHVARLLQVCAVRIGVSAASHRRADAGSGGSRTRTTATGRRIASGADWHDDDDDDDDDAYDTERVSRTCERDVGIERVVAESGSARCDAARVVACDRAREHARADTGQRARDGTRVWHCWRETLRQALRATARWCVAVVYALLCLTHLRHQHDVRH